MKRIAILPLAALAACAVKPDATDVASVKVEVDGPLIHVSGTLYGPFADDHFHCAAAKQAESFGATEMDWISGEVQTRHGARETGQYVYFVSGEEAVGLPAGYSDTVRGGPEPIGQWMTRCEGLPEASA